jgi:hypothetical protein
MRPPVKFSFPFVPNRENVVLDKGEVAIDPSNGNMYYGDGVTSGGLEVGSKSEIIEQLEAGEITLGGLKDLAYKDKIDVTIDLEAGKTIPIGFAPEETKNDNIDEGFIKNKMSWSVSPVSGATKNTYHTGSGEPSASLGDDGDLYTDTSNNQLYTKINGVWLKGKSGEDAVIYAIFTSTQLFYLKNGATSYEPNTINVNARKKLHDGTLGYPDVWFKAYYDDTLFYTSSEAENSVDLLISYNENTTKIVLEMYKDSGFTTLLDSEVIPVIKETGKLHITLSNDSAGVSCDAVGNVKSGALGYSYTYINVHDGKVKLEYEAGNTTTRGKFSVSIEESIGVTVGAITAHSDGYTCHIQNHTSLTQDNAVVKYRVQGTDLDGFAIDSIVEQNLFKVYDGVGVSSVNKNGETLTINYSNGGSDNFTVQNGSSVTVGNITTDGDGNTTVQLLDDNGSEIDTFTVPKGDGIESVVSTKVGSITTVTVNYDNGDIPYTFDIADGISPPDKFTWIKYADSPTSGMSDDPTGKLYIGIAHNKSSATESTNYSDYNWILIKGENGESTFTYYQTGLPSNPKVNELWYDPSTKMMKRYNGTGGWDIVGTKNQSDTETNDLIANASQTANWVQVNSKPNDSDIYNNQITKDNVIGTGIDANDVGADTFEIIPTGNYMSVKGNIVYKTTDNNSWDGGAYTLVPYTNGCVLTFRALYTGRHFMMGLDSNPTEGSSYNTIDYAFYITDANTECYESSTPRGILLYGLNVNHIYTIAYDGMDTIRYSINGILVRTVNGVGANRKFYMDSSFHSNNAVKILYWGQMTSVNGLKNSDLVDGSTTLDLTRHNNAGGWNNTYIDSNGKIQGVSSNAGTPVKNDLVQNYLESVKGKQLLKNDWTIGSGSVGMYNQNGGTSENYRVYGLNPYGHKDIIWECRPNSVSDADGGWNTSSFPIDKTRTYRFSVFVKTSNNNGTTHFGVGGYTVCNLNTTTSNGNPYFFGGGDLPSNNKWYLLVSYVFPYGQTGYSHVGEIIDCTTGKTVSGGIGCYNWANVTTSLHRCYLYYCTDTSTRQWMWHPRVDLVDGNEPSVIDLIGFVSADKIRAGLLQSINWNGSTAGSQFDLDSGTFTTIGSTLKTYLGANIYGSQTGYLHMYDTSNNEIIRMGVGQGTYNARLEIFDDKTKTDNAIASFQLVEDASVNYTNGDSTQGVVITKSQNGYTSPMFMGSALYVNDTKNSAYAPAIGAVLGAENSSGQAYSLICDSGHSWFQDLVKMDSSLEFYHGSTRIGEFSSLDTTWFRINQNTAKNIYTPRMIRADGGFQVDDKWVISSDGNTLYENGTALSSKYVQTAYNSTLNSDTRNSRGVTRLYRRDADTDYSVQVDWNGSSWLLRGYSGDMYHAECRVAYAGNADKLGGQYASATRNSANTIPVRDGNGFLNLGWINTTSGDTTSSISRVFIDIGDQYIRKCTLSHLKSQMGVGNGSEIQYFAESYNYYSSTFGKDIYISESTTKGTKITSFYIVSSGKSSSTSDWFNYGSFSGTFSVRAIYTNSSGSITSYNNSSWNGSTLLAPSGYHLIYLYIYCTTSISGSGHPCLVVNEGADIVLSSFGTASQTHNRFFAFLNTSPQNSMFMLRAVNY